jgi:hypothetical protein
VRLPAVSAPAPDRVDLEVLGTHHVPLVLALAGRVVVRHPGQVVQGQVGRVPLAHQAVARPGRLRPRP